MKIYQDVLSDHLLSDCKNNILEKTKIQCWECSQFFWPNNILDNVHGTCMITELNDEKLVKNITKSLELFFKHINYERLVFQYYIWHPYSGISQHRDGGYKFGATLYLNTVHSASDGGLFVWREDDYSDGLFNAVLPRENMLIINDQSEEHFVTNILPNSKNTRSTIQIWGL